jgi:hypothetical protein
MTYSGWEEGVEGDEGGKEDEGAVTMAQDSIA